MKKVLTGFVIVFFTFFVAIETPVSLACAKEALGLCANVLIPSVFPFFVCANYLISSGAARYSARKLSFIMKPVFGVSGAGAVALIMGFISGYPAGAMVTCRLFREKLISRGEAQRLLSFTNNPGPLFIVGAIGTAILSDTKAGYILWLSNFLAALTTGIIMRFIVKKDNNFSPLLKESDKKDNPVTDAVLNMLSLCGYVVFFSVILGFARKMGIIDFITIVLTKSGLSKENAFFMAQGFFELTTAAYKSRGVSLPFICAVLSWGGLSVLLQTLGIVKENGLSLKTYIKGKIVCSLLSFIICIAILKVTDYAMPVLKYNYHPSKLSFYFAYLFISAFLSVLILLLFRKISKTIQNGK